MSDNKFKIAVLSLASSVLNLRAAVGHMDFTNSKSGAKVEEYLNKCDEKINEFLGMMGDE